MKFGRFLLRKVRRSIAPESRHLTVEDLDQGSATCDPRAKSGPPNHFIRPAASFRNCVFIRPATSLRNYDN